ncbi:hypothetical protein D0C36_05635 [Mucilaginibacter conchicola]|uniref:Uncharacterized protein n=1 Tax=Mucilaginibacter conchicola TaxID=2303333 RepID=A0A372NZB6_9SPHI|nr:hypothetical protein [Mucilaginibacter conchicola]RFZ95009.1 hypothetical protein D0C36_05635 [Mucilaginibacter conchicola]
MALKINKDSYELYKKVFEALWQFKFELSKAQANTLGLDISQLESPIEVINRWEKESRSIALKGLKAGLVDTLTEMQLNLNTENLKTIDVILKGKNLPGFFDISAELKDSVKQVLKRGRIKTESEYYIIAELLSDTTASLKTEERFIFNKAVTDFELKQTSANNL